MASTSGVSDTPYAKILSNLGGLSATEVDLPEILARPWTYETDPRGKLGLLADRRRGVLVGAWAVAPLAAEWIHQAALAIRTETPISTLLDGVAQFPTYTEAYLQALEQLPLTTSVQR